MASGGGGGEHRCRVGSREVRTVGADGQPSENEKMKLTLAHEIRARAIACTPLGCMGMCSPCGRCRKEPRLLFLCATAASYKLCCPLSDEFLLSLIRSHKRADARDRKSSGFHHLALLAGRRAGIRSPGAR